MSFSTFSWQRTPATISVSSRILKTEEGQKHSPKDDSYPRHSQPLVTFSFVSICGSNTSSSLKYTATASSQKQEYYDYIYLCKTWVTIFTCVRQLQLPASNSCVCLCPVGITHSVPSVVYAHFNWPQKLLIGNNCHDNVILFTLCKQ